MDNYTEYTKYAELLSSSNKCAHKCHFIYTQLLTFKYFSEQSLSFELLLSDALTAFLDSQHNYNQLVSIINLKFNLNLSLLCLEVSQNA